MNKGTEHPRTLEQLVTNPARWRELFIMASVLGLWTLWTVQTEAYWFHQAIFVFVALTSAVLMTRPVWFLYFIVLILVGDVSGFLRELVQIPGLVGLAGIGGNIKLPELLSLLAVGHLVIYFFLHPNAFRQPLVGRMMLFLLAGMIGTAVGLRQHIPTSVMRDSLSYYFGVFFILGMVLVPDARGARALFRLFFYVAFCALLFCYVWLGATRSTAMFYPATVAMFFSACAYFLTAKLLTSPAGARKWLIVAVLALFSAAPFIGRSRGAVMSFVLGMVPMFLTLRMVDKLKILGGVVFPCVLLMVGLFAWEQRRAVHEELIDPGARGIEAFTRAGTAEHDPTGNYRLYMWGLAWHGFLENPVFGKGYGWRLPVWSRLSITDQDEPASIIHNSYIHILACNGLIGFLPLVVFIGSYYALCWRKWRAAKSRSHRLWIACAMGIALNFFLTSLTNVGFETVSCAAMGWLFVAIGVRLSGTSEEEIESLVSRRINTGGGEASAPRRVTDRS